jgi:site-specific DNA-methyltransferase (adenine-specific)
MKPYRTFRGDCIEGMRSLPDSSIDLILTDPPYGTTACKWDTIIPLEEMWAELKRVVKPNGAIVLFSAEPFTSILITSNLKGFKYRWDWDKKIPSGMSYARFRPMQQSEDICVFTVDGSKTVYNPQMVKRDKPIKGGGMSKGETTNNQNLKALKKTYDFKNPTTLLVFDKVRAGSVHPTQKPVALMEYLIRTYTNEGETVLDFTMGSGTTGVACVNTDRKFIGIELDPGYYEIARQRLKEAVDAMEAVSCSG